MSSTGKETTPKKETRSGLKLTRESVASIQHMCRENVIVTGRTADMYQPRSGLWMGRESSILRLTADYGEIEYTKTDSHGNPVVEKISAGDYFWKFHDQLRINVARVVFEPMPPPASGDAQVVCRGTDGVLAVNRWAYLRDTLPEPSTIDDPLNSRSVDFFLTLLAHGCGFPEATGAIVDHSRHPGGDALADCATAFHDRLGDEDDKDARLQAARLILFCLHRQRFEPWKGHPNFFIVIAGEEQGTGKSMLQYTIHGLFGGLACVLSASKLGSNFSDPSGLHKLCAIYEEMAPKGRFGDKESQGIIHSLRDRTTGPTRKFELKGKDSADVLNCLLEVFSTNTAAALQVDAYERRMLAVGPAPLPTRFDADDPETKPNVRTLIKSGFFKDYAAHFGMRRKADAAQGPGLADLVAYIRDLPELLQTVWGGLEHADAPRTEKARDMAQAVRSAGATEIAHLIEEGAQPFDKDHGKSRDILNQLDTLYPHITSRPTSTQALAAALGSLGAVQVRSSQHRVWVWRNLDRWVAYGATGNPVPSPELAAELEGSPVPNRVVDISRGKKA